MIRNFGAVTGLVSQPTGLDLGVGGGSNIKSIQRGITTLASASSSIDVAIPSVDLNKAAVVFGISENYNTGNSVGIYAVMGKLTSSTNINFSKGLTGADITIEWEVIEYNNVKSAQRGDVTIGVDNTNVAVTISNVNTAKSQVFSSLKTTAGHNTGTGITSAATLSSATNLNIRSAWYTGYVFTAHWQVIEFN